MKHLFLSGRRVDHAEALRTLFQERPDKNVLYDELLRKYEEGSLDRWLREHYQETWTGNPLPELCGYTPAPERRPPPRTGDGGSDRRLKRTKLRTTTWYHEDLFPASHDWSMTATTNGEMEEMIDLVREFCADEGTGKVYDLYVCNVGETYRIDPRQIGCLRLKGFGMPVIHLQCSYRETIDLRELALSFETVKLESAAPCRIIASDAELAGCALAPAIQVAQRQERRDTRDSVRKV